MLHLILIILTYGSTVDKGIRVMWCQCKCQWCDMTRTVMLHHILIILTEGMKWCNWWCYQHHMHHQHHVLLSLAPMASQECPVAPHFKCLDPMQWCHWWCCWQYVMLESVVSHDQKRHVAYHFNCLYLRKTNNAICDVVGIMWQWYWSQ